MVLACHCPLDVLFSFVRIERLSESRVGHVALGKSSDDAALSDEAVCLGLSLTLLSVVLSTVAGFCRLSPIKKWAATGL